MPRPRLTPQEQALEELSESPYDEPDNDADDTDIPSTPRDTPYRVQPIGEEGIYPGNVALPGGGQAEDDELDAAGVLTRDLRRKGVPEVWRHQEEMNGAPFRDPSAPAQYTELPAFMNSLQGHRGPALERYGTFAGDTGDIQTAQAERMRALLYNEARDEAALKGVQLPADYYDDLGGGYVASVDAPAVHGDDPDAILEDLARMNDNRARAGRY